MKLKPQRLLTGSIAPIQRKTDGQQRNLDGYEDEIRQLIDSSEARTFEG